MDTGPHRHDYYGPRDPADPARYADGCHRFWWHRLTPAEHAEFFCYFTPEQGLATMAEQGILGKFTDPEIVARVARIVAT
jgi:hypothetical protein